MLVPAFAPVQIDWGMRTDRGRVRESNEDAGVARPPLFVVADGMGGHAAGETASAAVAGRFGDPGPDAVTPEWITDRLVRANHDIRSGAGGGSTVTGAAIAERDGDIHWLVFNIGDSRAYLSRATGLRRITVDHSMVQEMVDAGTLSEQDARSHPGRHIITRAVGTAAEPRPDFWWVPVQPADRLLLCSDGLTGELDDATIAEILRRPQPAQDIADQLTEAALAAGGRDNITCVVVDVGRTEDRVTVERAPQVGESG